MQLLFHVNTKKHKITPRCRFLAHLYTTQCHIRWSRDTATPSSACLNQGNHRKPRWWHPLEIGGRTSLSGTYCREEPYLGDPVFVGHESHYTRAAQKKQNIPNIIPFMTWLSPNHFVFLYRPTCNIRTEQNKKSETILWGLGGFQGFKIFWKYCGAIIHIQSINYYTITIDNSGWVSKINFSSLTIQFEKCI